MLLIYEPKIGFAPCIDKGQGFECCDLEEYDKKIQEIEWEDNYSAGPRIENFAGAGIEGIQYYLDCLDKNTLGFREQAPEYAYLVNEEEHSGSFGDEWYWVVEYDGQHQCLVFKIWQENPY